MFDNNLLDTGFKPMFALINSNIIEIQSLDLQLQLFNKRVGKENIKTQHLKADDDNFLLVLYIKDINDDDSLAFVLNNMVVNGNIILAENIKSQRNL